MWPFSNRGSRLDVEESLLNRKSVVDFSVFAQNDVFIKLWMSDRILTSIDILTVQHNVSRPDILRWIFFEHVYGRERFCDLCNYAQSIKAADEGAIPQFSRKADTTRSINQRFLGKATEDVKLWLPNQLKTDLKALADAKHEGLSDYLRFVLVRHLYGERFYAEFQEALANINQNAVEHEQPGLPDAEQ